ncbi:unnamed protein product [Effrenium voratum]|uniref:peptidylprolyl isomerase n=1 Tax=Effrenium voratum TaxID=2562239 RepID=A0AA36IY35_9DINO|nr:unnamed protein product [Effrenium voratum]
MARHAARVVLACSVLGFVCFVPPLTAARGRIREARAALAAVPGVGLLSEETQTVSLAPGPLGLEVDAPTGLVQKVLEGGAGEKAGVQAGWVFQTVGGKPYEILALKELTRGEASYEASFALPKANPTAIFSTSMGDIEVEIFLDRVPRTASNFIDLAQSGFYDGVHFHRARDPQAKS